MDRRTFFRRGLKEAAEVAVKHADAQVSKRAGHWIRPPFALAELEFLLACTRCGECAVACPHGVVFLLPARLGAQVLGTPALDLLTKGCLLCEDWPCVGPVNRAPCACPRATTTNPARRHAWLWSPSTRRAVCPTAGPNVVSVPPAARCPRPCCGRARGRASTPVCARAAPCAGRPASSSPRRSTYAPCTGSRTGPLIHLPRRRDNPTGRYTRRTWVFGFLTCLDPGAGHIACRMPAPGPMRP